jgi:hypothetical protein
MPVTLRVELVPQRCQSQFGGFQSRYLAYLVADVERISIYLEKNVLIQHHPIFAMVGLDGMLNHA